jgi:hypothetical protein
MSFQEPTPVQILGLAPAAGEPAAAGGALPAGGSTLGPPPFEYLQQTPLPPNAVDARGGCSCT